MTRTNASSKNRNKKQRAVKVDKKVDKKKSNTHAPTSLLESILGMSFTKFQAEYFEKKPLHLSNVQPCSGLFSRQKLLEILSQQALEYTSDLTITHYKDNQRENYQPPDETTIATSKQVEKLMKNGYSVQFYQPQRYNDQLCTINAALEQQFGCLAGSSAYLTPPHAQALAPHHDDVDVFIFQTQGSKHWKLYAPLVPLAGEHSGDFTQDMIGEPTMEITLNEGDFLYFPRGMIHQACTSNAFSTHVTISIYHHTSWANFMEVALPRIVRRAFELDIEFRRGLPINYLSYMGTQFDGEHKSAQNFLSKCKNLVSQLLQHVDMHDMQEAADEASLDFVRNRLPPWPIQESKAPNVSALDPKAKFRLKEKEFMRLVVSEMDGMDVVTLHHSLDNCRLHHMGLCTCKEEDNEDNEEDNEEMDDEEEDNEEEESGEDNGIAFPIECFPILLHLYKTSPEFSTQEDLVQVADNDAVRGVLLRLVAENLLDTTC
ncbi:nucleolar protein [Thraustotheca clavata]|uniref:Bifunctional lysine-specific demethylase and histidyl-hydroxylase n=1 Tax=Thraustotheca clavata TaxID=74557 RepID=A0A1V9Y7A5_9STRA|nr:nucleolar protein [Thraustotheca clavata]